MNAYSAQDAQEERIDFTEDVIFGLSTETLEYLGTEKENEIREAIDKALRKRSSINGNGRLFRA
ncbi:hypothetical protein [Morganella morganii]|uniref:hypothetical protein n=1 Tax=Morganella morganii TaxID=582 RepID=UPI000BBD1AC7|nr:hypothetical protein [Morganella morganii]ATF52602.1 hypothetical protein CO693_02245 [Morganella morganii]ATF52907.1 hypothetical protein CO693_03895 [Morganella morganii]MDN3813646.1 hypothetical protein [Morganella morganii]